MSVEVSPFEVASGAPLRTEGVARLYAGRSAGQTIAIDIDEAGPLRLRFPRIAAPGTLEAVLVNTGGGIVGGDRLQFDIEAGEGASVAVTSQASEKIYRSAGMTAKISVRLAAAAGAQLAWLPQETILFDRVRVARSIEADVAGDASLTLCESIVFGRVAMGEAVANGSLKDRWRIRRDEKLIFADALTLDGPISDILARPATARGSLATATLVRVAPDTASKIDAVRAALEAQPVESGASAFDGMLIVRMLAGDGLSLHAATLDTLSALGIVPPRAFSL